MWLAVSKLCARPHHLNERAVGIAELGSAGNFRSFYFRAHLLQPAYSKVIAERRRRNAKMIHAGTLARRGLQQADARHADLEPDAVVVALRRRTEKLLVKRRRLLRVCNIQKNMIQGGGPKDRLLLHRRR